MASNFRITELALGDLDAIVAAVLHDVSAEAASRWLDGLETLVAGLTAEPFGHPLAIESGETGFEARQILYKSHRIVFTVGEGFVGILRVYRGARQRLTLNLLPA